MGAALKVKLVVLGILFLQPDAGNYWIYVEGVGKKLYRPIEIRSEQSLEPHEPLGREQGRDGRLDKRAGQKQRANRSVCLVFPPAIVISGQMDRRHVRYVTA